MPLRWFFFIILSFLAFHYTLFYFLRISGSTWYTKAQKMNNTAPLRRRWTWVRRQRNLSPIASHSLTSLCPWTKTIISFFLLYFILFYYCNVFHTWRISGEYEWESRPQRNKKLTQGPVWYQTPHGEARCFLSFFFFSLLFLSLSRYQMCFFPSILSRRLSDQKRVPWERESKWGHNFQDLTC